MVRGKIRTLEKETPRHKGEERPLNTSTKDRTQGAAAAVILDRPRTHARAKLLPRQRFNRDSISKSMRKLVV